MSKKTLIRCAVVLLAAILGLAIADNARPWKRLQSDFLALERQDLELRLESARSAAVEPLAELGRKIEAEQERLADRRDEIDQLEKDLRVFRGKREAAAQRRNRISSALEMKRWRIEAAAGPGPNASPAGAEEIAVLEEELRQTRMEVESFRELIVDRERKLDAVRAELNAAREHWSREQASIADLESRLAALGSSGLFSRGVRVREVSVTGFPREGGGERIDRCATCHLAATRGRLEGENRPRLFRGHRRPEGAPTNDDSPHPYGRFGCTVCHGGEGRATDFSRAGHTPSTVEQEAAWAETRGWRREALPAEPMLSLDLTEAACGRCHGAELSAVEAPALQAGQQLIAAMGCAGCHADGESAANELPEPKVGPSLLGIAGKTRPAWAYRWLESPRDRRPTTWMPHFFDSEGGGEAESARRSTEIRTVVHYLWERSRPAAYEPPPAGDPAAGKVLYDGVGCIGCHLLTPGTAPSAALELRQGPHLAGTGSKVSPEWLYAWLRDPRAYRRDTPMPSLRLDQQEAADLTAYLMTRRDPQWENLELPSVVGKTRDALVLSHLEERHTVEESQARLERMSERDKNNYLGERTIARYGCHGCHQIAGFEAGSEERPPIAAALTRVDRRWLPSAHRPVYGSSDAETRAVVIALLGSASRSPAAIDDRGAALAAGRRIIARYGCRGCHLIEGQGRPATSADVAGPDLTHTGARLKSPWLFAYLTDPGRVTVRPWLTSRMPSYGLSEAENNALVRYFAALDGRDLFSSDPPPDLSTRDPFTGDPRTGRTASMRADLAVGKAVFGMLQCGDCHRDTGPGFRELAPSYSLARDRLRGDWVVSWILDPEKWLPETRMPASFLTGDGSLTSTFLIGSIETPIFAVERDRLLRLFGSEEELHAYLSDPEKVAVALKEHLWTLSE